MTKAQTKQALAIAVDSSKAAGALMRKNLRSKKKKINEQSQHDIKLDLDVRCQKLIEKTLRGAFPDFSVLGEEGTLGDITSEYRWVVDPIDGTVNFTYGFPHACVSIALQRRLKKPKSAKLAREFPDLNYETVIGVIYDPFQDELWTAVRGEAARLNGSKIEVSARGKLEESILAMGFSKDVATLDRTLPMFNRIVYRMRKIRLMGSAALSLTYVATARIDAYREDKVRLWDIAAGGLIIECAGGEFWTKPISGEAHAYQLVASNGLLRKKLERAANGK